MESDSDGSESDRQLRRILGPFLRVFSKKHRSQEASEEDSFSQSDCQLEMAPDALQNLDERQIKMIRAILKMEEVSVREIMVPRVDMMALEVGTSVADIVKLMVEGGHSRIPLYEETIDKTFGVIHSRDVLRMVIGDDQHSDLRAVARPALFVPESKRLSDLLKEFQEKRVSIAIVVDEYGGVAGLVTIEDLLEEIVGEIEDEFKEGEPEVVSVSENEAVLDARISLDRVNELFSTKIEGDGFDTLGGAVYKHLGKIPVPGDKVQDGDLSMEVLSTVGRRIKKVRVVKLPLDSRRDIRS